MGLNYMENDIPIIEVIVIGSGHAGLSISYLLKKHNVNHIVLEKDKIGSSWLNQRWDSFKMITPNSLNTLPESNVIEKPDEFCTAKDFVNFLKNYVKKYNLPVKEGYKVDTVEKNKDSKYFSICVNNNGHLLRYLSKQVVVASGGLNKKIIPEFSNQLSDKILQLHASEYRNPKSLPDGAVLIVGSAQSGVQIAEDLLFAGKKVFISTSPVGRIPRKYRGQDIEEWFVITGFYNDHLNDLKDKLSINEKQPILSDIGFDGHTGSLQSLAKRGVVILGSLENIKEGCLLLQNNARENIDFGDKLYKDTKITIENFILKSKLSYPEPEEDIVDDSEIEELISKEFSIELKKNNIQTVIWATGFGGDFKYLKFPIFNPDGEIRHTEGVSDVLGLCFLGLPWLRKRKSGIIYGVKEDAEFIVKKILETL